ncbi:hypothetical protein ACJK6Q_15700 (plasmid) [Enterococcus faecium]|nr:hypothetical protein [Enterococcus faecium]HAQ4087710.1 hypothetical protein [Enterococcus faecium]HAZ9116785.1 hypothetical protein [Enterococcus faecium]HCC1521534.1 hypothetical protein [Enterococcus faecium]
MKITGAKEPIDRREANASDLQTCSYGLTNDETLEEHERGAIWSISKIVESVSHAKGLLEISAGRLSELSSIATFQNQGEIFYKLDEVDKILNEVKSYMEFEKVKFTDQNQLKNL